MSTEPETPYKAPDTTETITTLVGRAPHAARMPFLVMVVAVMGILIYTLVGTPKTDSSGKPMRTAEQLSEINTQVRDLIFSKYAGESMNADQLALVARIGEAISTRSDAKDSPVKLKFILLAEQNAINSFALPTGEIYVTTALVNRMRTEGELAAALANGAAHVLARHHMDLPEPPAPMIPVYTLKQEAAVDTRALKIMSDAGYDPRAMNGMFEVLTAAYSAGADAQFFSTHPSVDGRLVNITEDIQTIFPKGIPEILSK